MSCFPQVISSKACTAVGTELEPEPGVVLRCTALFLVVVYLDSCCRSDSLFCCFGLYSALGLSVCLPLQDLVSRHFAAASLSLKVTRSFDAVRMLTMSCLAALTDVVMRVIACDTPSPCSLHYSGRAKGEDFVFCIECRAYVPVYGRATRLRMYAWASRLMVINTFIFCVWVPLFFVVVWRDVSCSRVLHTLSRCSVHTPATGYRWCRGFLWKRLCAL